MTTAEIQESHSVELEIFMNGKKTTLLTSVEQIVGNKVLLTPIQMNGKVVGFPPDCVVNLLYVEEKHVYCWKGIKIKAIKYENKVYHCAELVAEAELLNRRGAYRVYIGSQMLLTCFTANGPKTIKVLVKDISESGMSFFSQEEFSVGRTVRLHLRVGEKHELQLSSQIIRTQDFEDKIETLYGCKFSEKNPQLTNFLMKIQQEKQRQKLGI